MTTTRTTPIIITTPQPDKEEMLVLIPPDALCGSRRENGTFAVGADYARDATPADLARAGWVPSVGYLASAGPDPMPVVRAALAWVDSRDSADRGRETSALYRSVDAYRKTNAPSGGTVLFRPTPAPWERMFDDSARLRAAEAELERLRGALRGMLATHDQSHSEECNAWTARDEDVCRCEAGCPEPHCDCGSTEARNAARAALGEP